MMSTTSWYHNTQLAAGKTQDWGTGNMNFIMFTQPIITKQLNLEDMTYTASPRPWQTQPYPYDGHTINFEIELFGCDNFLLDESKKKFSTAFLVSFFSWS
jgi:hypothetical protein